MAALRLGTSGRQFSAAVCPRNARVPGVDTNLDRLRADDHGVLGTFRVVFQRSRNDHSGGVRDRFRLVGLSAGPRPVHQETARHPDSDHRIPHLRISAVGSAAGRGRCLLAGSPRRGGRWRHLGVAASSSFQVGRQW